jgi:serine/threonine-protein kinase
LLYEMLSGKPPYEGDNFMEILHKKANALPKLLSTIRQDVPPVLEALIMRTLAKDPAMRPQSMGELERELAAIAAMFYPSLAKIDLDSVDQVLRRGSSGSSVRPAFSSTGALLARMRTWERKKVAMAAGGLLGLMLAFIVVGATANNRHGSHAPAQAMAAPAVVVPPPAPVAPPAATALPPSTPPAAAAVEPTAAEGEEASDSAEEGEDETAAPSERDGTSRREGEAGKGSGKGGRVSAAENRRLLREGERLLRAERFPEAREVFEKLAHSRRDRGPALVGLAEISVQEKNYAQAVRSAQKASESGGGVRARVLLGDAHFRLNHFKEAARAYEEALKADPDNASAKSGLALANKRM